MNIRMGGSVILNAANILARLAITLTILTSQQKELPIVLNTSPVNTERFKCLFRESLSLNVSKKNDVKFEDLKSSGILQRKQANSTSVDNTFRLESSSTPL